MSSESISTSSSINSVHEYEVYKNTKIVTNVKMMIEEILQDKNYYDEKQIKNIFKLSFYSTARVTISMSSYLDRIVKYTKIEESTLITALIYLDRVCDYNDLFLDKYNIHRIFLASVLVAIKYNEDDFYTNNFYSKVAGISIKELNLLEFQFVKLLNYNLFVENEVYDKYKSYLDDYKSNIFKC